MCQCCCGGRLCGGFALLIAERDLYVVDIACLCVRVCVAVVVNIMVVWGSLQLTLDKWDKSFDKLLCGCLRPLASTM
jgi:hypothetical protein